MERDHASVHNRRSTCNCNSCRSGTGLGRTDQRGAAQAEWTVLAQSWGRERSGLGILATVRTAGQHLGPRDAPGYSSSHLTRPSPNAAVVLGPHSPMWGLFYSPRGLTERRRAQACPSPRFNEVCGDKLLLSTASLSARFEAFTADTQNIRDPELWSWASS
jgi:hypothetical protein